MASIRVLIAKPGLDGHDRGALVVARGLRDHGMEVIYTGLRQTPAQIVATAIQEDVACIGLSSLSGAHMELFPEVVRLLREQQADDILVIGGGVIPSEDIPALQAAGIKAVFTPGTPISEIAAFIEANVRRQDLTFNSLPALVKSVDHIGIAVADIARALPLYGGFLGLTATGEEHLTEMGVKVVFIKAGGVDIELLEPVAPDSPVARFLERHGPGLHHIAYAVEDVQAALAWAKAAGYRLLDEQPRPGARGKWVGFLHPRDTYGVLTEFCQPAPESGERPPGAKETAN